MLKNYIKVAFRNIKKHKVFTFINIFGLSVGFAVFTLIMLYAINEFSYDKFNEKIERIYRLDYADWGILAPAHSTFVKEKISEIENTVRIDAMNGNGALLETDKTQIKAKNMIFADSSIFDIFSIDLIRGSLKEFESDKFSILLTRSLAKKLFGDKDPIGKVIKFKKRKNLRVVGLLETVEKSHINITAIGNFQALPKITGQENMLERFSGANWPTYLLLSKKANPQKVTEKINNLPFYNRNNTQPKFNLKPLKDLYFDNNANYESGTVHGNLDMLYSLMIIAFFIIVMASINFINLTTAISGLRQKEIGIRKVTGGTKKQLIIQFLIEAILICVLSLLISLVIVDVILPSFNNILGVNLEFGLSQNFAFVMVLFVFSVLVGFISGIYPAFYLTSHKTTEIFRPLNKNFLKGGILRNTLTVIQITISAFLIFSTVIVYMQLQYMRNKDLGMNIDRILTLSINSKLKQNQSAFINELENNPAIHKVSISNATPGDIGWQESRSVNNENHQFTFHICDESFFQIYEIEKVKGRFFDSDSEADKYYKVLINETAMKKFGFSRDNVLGKKIGTGKNAMEIIGLVRDFHFNSLHEKIAPLVITNYDKWSYRASVKLKGDMISQGLKHVEKTFKRLSPGYPFNYNFIDKRFDSFYKKEERLGEMFIFFSAVAISIAVLGIFGLTAFQAKKRFKEIGIRKVLGAEPKNIIVILTKSILLLILISNLIAIILNVAIMQNWLTNFPFRINLSYLPYIVGFFISAFVTLFTVWIISYKAANQNPVDSIKYE